MRSDLNAAKQLLIGAAVDADSRDRTVAREEEIVSAVDQDAGHPGKVG